MFAYKQRVEGNKTRLLIAAWVTCGKEASKGARHRVGMADSHGVDLKQGKNTVNKYCFSENTLKLP